MGKPTGSADHDPESAFGPKQRGTQLSRQAARGQSREECNPSHPLSLSLCSAFGIGEGACRGRNSFGGPL